MKYITLLSVRAACLKHWEGSSFAFCCCHTGQFAAMLSGKMQQICHFFAQSDSMGWSFKRVYNIYCAKQPQSQYSYILWGNRYFWRHIFQDMGQKQILIRKNARGADELGISLQGHSQAFCLRGGGGLSAIKYSSRTRISRKWDQLQTSTHVNQAITHVISTINSIVWFTHLWFLPWFDKRASMH